MLLAASDPGGARRAAETALSIEPDAVLPRLLLAEAFLATDDREDLERAAALADETENLARRHAERPRYSSQRAEQFQRFTDTYQGGPLTGLAHLMRGEALQKMGLTSSAARAYLESYSGTPNGPTSPTALLKLGLALNGLGQTSEACITLGEVTARFPATDASIEAQAARANMGCT